MPPHVQTPNKSALKFLWTFLRPDRRVVFGILALLVVNNGFSLVEPYLFKIVVDDFLVKLDVAATIPAQADFLRRLGVILAAWVGVAFISRVAKNFQDFFTTMVADRTGIRVFDHALGHVLGLSMDFHESKRTGEILRKLTKAREDITKLVKVISDKILQNGATLVFVLTFSLIKEWRIGLLIAASIPVFILTTTLIARKIKQLAHDINAQQEQLQGGAVQALDHVGVVKAFRTEEFERRQATDRNWRGNQFLAKQTRYWRTLLFVQGTLINAFRTAIIGYGTFLAFDGTMTPGDVVFFTFYAVGIYQPLYELSDVYTAYQEGMSSIERLREILDQRPTVAAPHPGFVSDRQDLTVEFDRVSFAYHPSRQILQDVSFRLTPGRKLAVVGGSGGGKSTLTKLLLRYYDVTGGRILVNDRDIRDWNLEALRSRIATVFQENLLFNDTIAKNIRYGSFTAGDEAVREAASLANADEFIRRLPEQYETVVGERGIKLSGGERQRIAIARAVLKRPALYIFDEATASLDSTSERLVQAAIDHASAGAASLTIAHRLSTIVNADEILVLMHGRIVERGRHEDLLAAGGDYAKLYQTQRSEQSGPAAA